MSYVSYKITDDIIELAKMRHTKEGVFNGTRKNNGAGNIIGILGEFVVAKYFPDFKLNVEVSYVHDGMIGDVPCDIKSKTREQVPAENYEGSVPSAQINNQEGIYIFVQLVGCKFDNSTLNLANDSSFEMFRGKDCYILGYIGKKEFWEHKDTVIRKKGEKMPLSGGKFYICKDNDHFLEYKYLHRMSELTKSNSGNKMATGNETGIEISYMKRFNLGNYQHKEYSVKLNGTEAQIEQQFNERKERLRGYLEQMENIVDFAHEANLLKARAERENLLKHAAAEEKRTLLEATSEKKLDKVS